MEGLQGILPTQSILMVNTAVLHPSRAAANPASIPAWPAPITATSYAFAKYSITYLHKIFQKSDLPQPVLPGHR